MGEHTYLTSLLCSECGSRLMLPPPMLDSGRLPPRACSREPAAVLVAVREAEQPYDILEAWRSRRREAQTGQLAEKYGRYLLLQQLPAAARAPDQDQARVRAAGAPLSAAARLQADWAGGAPTAVTGTGLRQQQWPQNQRQQASSINFGSTSPQVEGGSDILERWRARRRQQQQNQLGSAARATADYGSLLTLSPPGSAPAPASQAPALAACSTMPLGAQHAAAASVAAVAAQPHAAAAAAEAAQRKQDVSAFSCRAVAASIEHSGQTTQPARTASDDSAAALVDALEAGAPAAPLAAAVTPAPFKSGCSGGSGSHLVPLAPPESAAAHSEQAAAQDSSGGTAVCAAAEASAPSRQPSRPASAASTGSGRATPRSSLALDRCAALLRCCVAALPALS
jgi:hypothetical protein